MFFVRGTLTREDRRAWKRLVVQRNRVIRRTRRAAVGGWLDQKLTGIVGLIFGGLTAFAVVTGGMSVFWLIAVPFWLAGGAILLMKKYSAGRPPAPLPEACFPPAEPPDAPMGAVFFGDGCFAFWTASEKTRLGYRAMTAAWEDGERFYLLLDNLPPLVLPKRGFVRRTPEEFRGFLEQTLGTPVEKADAPLK